MKVLLQIFGIIAGCVIVLGAFIFLSGFLIVKAFSFSVILGILVVGALFGLAGTAIIGFLLWLVG